MDALPSVEMELRLLDAVLFEFSSRGGDPAIIAELVHLGANPTIPGKAAGARRSQTR